MNYELYKSQFSCALPRLDSILLSPALYWFQKRKGAGSMKGDSMRLVLAGGMIGLLVLSAAAWKAVWGSAPRTAAPVSDPEAVAVSEAPDPQDGAALVSRETGGTAEETEAAFGADAVPIFAEDAATGEGAAGPFAVALRVTEAVWGEKLFLCDGTGSPLEEIPPNRDGDLTLGPLAPGRYGVCRGEMEIGAFRLYGNASLGEAGGRLWTDGELLHLERFVPGTASLGLTLDAPGYYSLRLCDQVGREWSRDLYIPDSERPNRGQSYRRTVEFQGLPEGLYTLVYRSTPLGRVEVRAGETTEFEWTIDN